MVTDIQKLADFIVGNETCSLLDDYLSANKIGRFLHDRRQFFVGRFYWQTKSSNFIDRLTSSFD